jgi:hypothetical protein
MKRGQALDLNSQIVSRISDKQASVCTPVDFQHRRGPNSVRPAG